MKSISLGFLSCLLLSSVTTLARTDLYEKPVKIRDSLPRDVRPHPVVRRQAATSTLDCSTPASTVSAAEAKDSAVATSIAPLSPVISKAPNAAVFGGFGGGRFGQDGSGRGRSTKAVGTVSGEMTTASAGAAGAATSKGTNNAAAGEFGGSRSAGGGDGGGGGGNKGGAAASTTAVSTTAAAVAAGNTAVAVNENGQAGPAVPQLTINGGLTLDKSLLLTTEGNGNATLGQATSAVSNNNFISFCQGKTLTNGQQVAGGSCALTPVGDIPSNQHLVSTMFVSPTNGANVPAGKTFTIKLAVQGMTLGSFTDAKKDYYAGPQQLAADGTIVGHAHVVIQPMGSAGSTAVLNPNVFAFFKGLDFAAGADGTSDVDVSGGLAAGAYRICTIMSNSNHLSVVLPVAQRGAENTCSYFNIQ